MHLEWENWQYIEQEKGFPNDLPFTLKVILLEFDRACPIKTFLAVDNSNSLDSVSRNPLQFTATSP
jgi:hypothetical protein